MLQYALMFFSMVFAVQAEKGRCPWALGKYPFDNAKFAGEWRLIATTPIEEAMQETCGVYSLTHLDHGDNVGLDVAFSAHDADEGVVHYESVTQSFKPEMASMSIGVWRKKGDKEWSAVFKQSVVSTDYDTYALYVACEPVFMEDSKTFERDLVAQIWSRHDSLAPETLATLTTVLSSYDVDPATITVLDRSGCS